MHNPKENVGVYIFYLWRELTIFKNIKCTNNYSKIFDHNLDDLFSGDRFLRRDDLINLFNKQAPSDDMKDSMDNKPQRPKIDNLGGIHTIT